MKILLKKSNDHNDHKQWSLKVILLNAVVITTHVKSFVDTTTFFCVFSRFCNICSTSMSVPHPNGVLHQLICSNYVWSTDLVRESCSEITVLHNMKNINCNFLGLTAKCCTTLTWCNCNTTSQPVDEWKFIMCCVSQLQPHDYSSFTFGNPI